MTKVWDIAKIGAHWDLGMGMVCRATCQVCAKKALLKTTGELPPPPPTPWTRTPRAATKLDPHLITHSQRSAVKISKIDAMSRILGVELRIA